MARYIDADALKTEILMKYKMNWEVPCSSEDRLIQRTVTDLRVLIERSVATDVVPKSEVESIFNDIEKEIDRGLSVITKILNAKGGRENGKTVLLSKYDVFIEAKKYIAELKKKYIGEEK